MTPSLIESYAAEIGSDVSCSSSVDYDDRHVGMTESSSDLTIREPAVSASSSVKKPRFTLKKRASNNQRGALISSCNSDFLSGLFADIAKASTHCQEPQEDFTLDDTLARKKSRLSLTRSISRCRRSYANLAAVSPSPEEGRKCIDIALFIKKDAPKTHRASSQDSLHHCVSSGSSSVEDSSDFSKLVFPRFPTSVGETASSFSLSNTRKGQQSPETISLSASGEKYGWFVETDDDGAADHDVVNAYYKSTTASNTKSLAFTAPTAPKASCQDAEVEWAKAADTIDDVLGDFF